MTGQTVTRTVIWPDPQVCADLDELRRRAPLVHLHTNPVALALTANLLAAVGAVPAARGIVETPDALPGATPDGVLVNLGVRTAERPPVWLAAARAAVRDGVPWVLDPIGANSAYPQARALAAELLTIGPQVVRGNGSEIDALAGGPLSGRGPDSHLSATQVGAAAVRLAARHTTVVAVSGPTDLVTDGHQVVLVSGGHPLMPRVSALGCALGALVAAFAAVSPSPLDAAVSASAVLAEAGSRAGRLARGPGTLVPHLVDAVHTLRPDS